MHGTRASIRQPLETARGACVACTTPAAQPCMPEKSRPRSAAAAAAAGRARRTAAAPEVLVSQVARVWGVCVCVCACVRCQTRRVSCGPDSSVPPSAARPRVSQQHSTRCATRATAPQLTEKHSTRHNTQASAHAPRPARSCTADATCREACARSLSRRRTPRRQAVWVSQCMHRTVSARDFEL